jgi:simple sugar transport system permease protein
MTGTHVTGDRLPRWVDLALIPLINLLAALLIAGLVVIAVGESPWVALKALVWGAFGSWEQIGFTLY